jgi:hypothetical protein
MEADDGGSMETSATLWLHRRGRDGRTLFRFGSRGRIVVMIGAANASGRSWRVSFRTGGRRRCCYRRSPGWPIQDSPTTIGTASPRNGGAPSRRHLRAINAHHLHAHRFYVHDTVPGFAQGGISRADQGPERRAAGVPLDQQPVCALGEGAAQECGGPYLSSTGPGMALPPADNPLRHRRRRWPMSATEGAKPSLLDYIVQLSLDWHRLSRPC